MNSPDSSGATTHAVLGWKEDAALPEWDISKLRVKLDTGAKTSAIGISGTEVVGTHMLDGLELPVLRLRIPLSRRNPDRAVEVTAPVVGYKSVRDSSANAERRPVVRTRLVCGPIDRDIDITLTDRSGMLFRMILGRQALDGVLVDSSREYTMRRRPPGAVT